MCSRFLRIAAAALAVAALAACEREERRFRELGPALDRTRTERLSTLRPGPATNAVAIENPYEANAHAIAEGKRLFVWFNCNGCHANGGGAIGPPLMDAEWIYGSDPENVFATIVEGRPNGMPAFGGKIPDYQVWQLVAYVRSLSGHVRKDAAPGRSDHMHTKVRELAKETEPTIPAPGKVR